MRTLALLLMACATSVSFVIVVGGLAELWTWGLGTLQTHEIVAFFWMAGPGSWLVKRWADGGPGRIAVAQAKLEAMRTAKLARASSPTRGKLR